MGRMQAIWKIMAPLALLFVCGCPQDRPAGGQGTAAASGQFAEYAAIMGRQVSFEDELKRLQALYSTQANPAEVAGGSAQQSYKLGTRLTDDGVAIVIRDNVSKAEQVLWVWQDDLGDQAVPQLVSQQEIAGGMSLEYQLDHDIFLAISLRWVQDRYLEVKRTLTAGGLDMQFDCSPGMRGWTLDCASLPYRLLPAVNGPFGVVPEAQADQGWHGSSYPGEMMLPALCAYDQSGGVLLAIADEHPRKLDRRYECEWRLSGDGGAAEGNAQLRIDCNIYDNTSDTWIAPILFSGLPQRDSVVLEPFSLRATQIDDSFVAGTTQQVARRIADFTRAFQASYAGRAMEDPSSIMALDELSTDAARLEEMLRLKSGPWNVRGLLLDSRDGATLPDGMQPLVLPGDCAALADEYGIANWQWLAPFCLPGNSAQLAADPEMRLLLPGSKTDAAVGLSLRRPATLDSLLTGFKENPGNRHYLLDPQLAQDGGQDQLRMKLICSQQAAAALLTMKLCEENGKRDDPGQLAISGLPSLATGPCAGMYVLPAGDGSSILQQRMLGLLITEIFGVYAWPGLACDNPAQLASAVTAQSGGMIVNEKLLDYPGTESMLEHSDSLFSEAGPVADYLMLHAAPRYGSYTLVGESPAAPELLVLGLPAKWSGLDDIFVSVQGTSLDALIDRDNQWLNLQTGDGETVLQEMPFGMYELLHPDPANIAGGDILVIHRGLLSGGGNGDQG